MVQKLKQYVLRYRLIVPPTNESSMVITAKIKAQGAIHVAKKLINHACRFFLRKPPR